MSTTNDKQKLYQILCIKLVLSDNEKFWKETIELRFDTIERVKEVSAKIRFDLNSELSYICFGPDDCGKGPCIARDLIDRVDTTVCEDVDPAVEAAKETIEDIRDKVNKILKKVEEKQNTITITPAPYTLPYIDDSWKRTPIWKPITTVYAVAVPPITGDGWWWTSTNSVNLDESSVVCEVKNQK